MPAVHPAAVPVPTVIVPSVLPVVAHHDALPAGAGLTQLVAVVYFTVQICGLGVAELGMRPKVPLIAFLLVQNVGYLVTFTAGGQTLGKMAAGIRVVSSESPGSLDLGRAFLRTAMWLLLAVPAGLGFVSAIVSRDHRGLHDRFAGTRVVRASV